MRQLLSTRQPTTRGIRKWHWTMPLGLLIGTLWVGSVATPTMADSGPASLDLIAQSPWIDNEGDLAIQLRITGDAHNTVLRLGLHPAVDRRGLLALKDNPILKMPESTLSIDVDDVINSAGVASLTLPVSPDGILRSRPGEVSPLTVELLAVDGRSLDRLTTPASP